MEKKLGEDAVLEVNWTQLSEELGHIQYNSSYDIYKAEGIAKSQEELGAINHPHKIRDYDSEKYWGEIIMFLHQGILPDDKQAALQLLN